MDKTQIAMEKILAPPYPEGFEFPLVFRSAAIEPVVKALSR